MIKKNTYKKIIKKIIEGKSKIIKTQKING